MRKFLSLLVALATVTMAWAAQGGTLTSSKTPIDPTQTVTLTYDGTGTNFANWEPSCFIHAWLVAADGQTLSKSYSTDWASCNGDGDYASLASKLKMTYSGTKGKYTISMNIKEFFNVADADLPKIGKLGVIVRAQYEGDNNKTNDMFVNVAYTAPASKVTYTALTKAPTTGNWAGQYLIVWADNKAHATVSGKDLAATSDVLTITDGEIEINSTDKYYVTVELMQGGYSIKLPSGKYLSVNANDNKVAEVNNAYAFNFEYTASGVKIFGKDTQGNVRYVFNNGTYYRSYKWNDSYKLPTLYRTGDEAPALQTLYFVNTLDWAKVNAFVWPATGDAYKAWPGEAAVKTGEKALEKDIYSYTFPATFVNAIFNNGTAQTTDLKWDKAKPYFVPGDADGEGKFTGTWYASTSEIPVPCEDGPYSLLVNGTDTIKSVKGDEFDGYTQYVVYASLTKNDKIQVLNESCGALWMPAIEEGGASAHFKKGENDATIDSTGCFDLYIKMKAGEDKVYIGYGICEGDSVAPCLDGPYSLLVNGTDTIKSVKGDEFDGYTQYVVYASLTKNDKIQVLNESCGALWMPAIEEGGASAHFKKGENDATIDSTGCFDLYIKMKAGEDKVYIGYGICEGDSVAPCLDGPYGFIVNGTDTLKAVALEEADAQGRKQYLIDSVALKANDKFVVANLSCDSKWVMDVEEYGAYANFTKGEDAYTVKVDGMYAFYIKMSLEAGDVMYIGEIKDEPAGGCDWDNLPWLGSTDAAYAEQFKVCVGDPAPSSVVNIQSPGWATEIGIYITFPSAAFGQISLSEGQYAIQGAGMLLYVSAFTAKETEVSVVCENVEYVFTVYNDKGGEPVCKDKYGLKVGDNVVEFTKNEAQTEWTEYYKQGVELTQGQFIALYNICEETAFTATIAGYEGFTPATGGWTVTETAKYDFYLKLIYGADELYVVKQGSGDTKFYMKNNWNAGADWTWKEMTKDGDNFKLENVVFGGSGVNYNTSETDEGAAWVEVADILGDKIAAKDTVTFVLNPTAKTVTATIVGKYIPTGDVQYFMKNNWNAGADWTWKEMTKDGDNYKLENVVYGGTGVNYNTEATDANATWVAEEDILGDKIAAKDTVTLTLNPVAGTVTAKLIGKYQEGTEPENAYGLMINGTTFVKAELNPATANEYMALGVELTAGQTLQVFDKANNVGWVITNWNEGSYQFTIENDKYVVTETAKYDFYFKLDFGNDYIYVAKKETPSAIDNLMAPANEMRKVMIDGKLYILRDGKVYSVQGQLIR